jgi:hypothetical protein
VTDSQHEQQSTEPNANADANANVQVIPPANLPYAQITSEVRAALANYLDGIREHYLENDELEPEFACTQLADELTATANQLRTMNDVRSNTTITDYDGANTGQGQEGGLTLRADKPNQ